MPSSGSVTLTAWTRDMSWVRTSPTRARQVMPALFTSPCTRPYASLSLAARPAQVPLAGVEVPAAVGGFDIGGADAGALPDQGLGLGGAPAAGRTGDHDDLAEQPLGVRVALGRSRDRRRPTGRGMGSAPGTRVLDTLPMPSTVSVTGSPGLR